MSSLYDLQPPNLQGHRRGAKTCGCSWCHAARSNTTLAEWIAAHDAKDPPCSNACLADACCYVRDEASKAAAASHQAAWSGDTKPLGADHQAAWSGDTKPLGAGQQAGKKPLVAEQAGKKPLVADVMAKLGRRRMASLSTEERKAFSQKGNAAKKAKSQKGFSPERMNRLSAWQEANAGLLEGSD